MALADTRRPAECALEKDIAERTPPGNWTYSTYVDEMTDVTIKVACTTSTNELTFRISYDEGSSGRLCFRRKGKLLNAYATIAAGQFACGIESCSVRLKCDDGRVSNFTGTLSSAHEDTMLFVDSEAARLLEAVQATKRLKLQAEYYQAGNQVLTFDVVGLDMAKL